MAAGELPYDQVDWTQPCVLVVGGETTGNQVPEAPRQSAGLRCGYRCEGGAESLNAAMAATSALVRSRAPAQTRRAPNLKARDTVS